MKRQHPVKILMLMPKNFWLLAIPLARGLLTLRIDFVTLTDWVHGVWLDILVVLFIILAAYFKWFFTTFSFSKDGITCDSGIFVRVHNAIPMNKICAVTGEKKFWLRPFRAVNIYFDNETGIPKKTAVSLTVRYSDYREMFDILAEKKDGGIKASYRAKKTHLIFFSILFSSTLSGMIFLSTFFIQSGKLVGEYFESQLRMTVDNVITQVDRLVTGIPRAAVTVLLVILAGWLWSAGANLLRSIGFRIERANSTVSIRSGIFTKRHYFIDTDKIFCADLRQNILMKLFSVSSVQVDCAGYGQGKNEIPVFIPITTKQNILSSIKLLLPKLNITPPEVKPRPIVFFRYICTPLYIMLGIVPAAWIMIKFFPLWDSFIIFVAVMLEIPSLIFLATKVVSFFTTGISVSGDTVSIKYGWGLRFHTVIVRRDNIAKISITQSVFQKLSKSCNVTFYTKNKLMKFHFVLSLPCEETTKYLKQTGLCEQNLIF